MRKGGTFVKVGYDPNPLEISLDDVVRRAIKIIGHYAYDYMSCSSVLNLLESGKLDLRTLITKCFPLERWKEGFEAAESENGLKIILEP